VVNPFSTTSVTTYVIRLAVENGKIDRQINNQTAS
jgi:hypothetical protein